MSNQNKKYQDFELQHAALTAIGSVLVFALTVIMLGALFALLTQFADLSRIYFAFFENF